MLIHDSRWIGDGRRMAVPWTLSIVEKEYTKAVRTVICRRAKEACKAY